MTRFQQWVFIFGLALAGQARAADGGAPGHYTGKAVDDQGRPVAGATVECYLDSSPAAAYTGRNFVLKERGTTDSEGGFAVSAGEGVAIVVVKKEGLAAGWRTFASVPGNSGDPVVLTAPTALAGLVVDEKEDPVADAEVWVSMAFPELERGASVQRNTILGKPARDCFSVRTTADGHFRIANLPTNTQADLAVRKAGQGQRVRANFGGTPDRNSGEEAIKLTLDQPGSIEGRVTVEGTGQPLSGVKLRWLGFNGGLSGLDVPEPVLSDADGSFRIVDVAQGTAAISAVFPGEPVADWVAVNVSLTLAAGESKKDVQVVAVKGGVVAITVLSQNGREPLTNANVAAYGQLSESAASAETGADGMARLRLPAGNWSFVVGKEGWNSGRTGTVVMTGQTNQVTVMMNPTWKITGTVRDPGGAPVVGAIVSFAQNFGNNREVKTDIFGRYNIRWETPNFEFGFRTVRSGFGGNSSSLIARSVERNLVGTHEVDESATNVDLRLKPAVTISAKVEDATGRPVANAIGNVSVMNANGGYAGPGAQPSVSDALGRLVFTGLFPAESYSVSVSAKGYGSSSQQIPAPDRETNRIEFPAFVLLPANKILAGVVLGPDSKPVPGANVSIQGNGQPAGNTKTDAEGRFAFEAVCVGTVELFAYFQGAANNYLNANARAQGGDTNVVIQFAANNAGGNERAVTTSGTVLDPSGAPVAGASLVIFPNRGAEIKSDDAGKYSITWRSQYNGQTPFLLARETERHLALGRELDGTVTNLDLRLQPALTLSLKVQDAKGKPIPMARASLDVWSGNATFSVDPGSATTDDQGVVEFKDLPPERHYRARVDANGFGLASIEAQAGETKTNRFNFPVVVLKAADRKLAGQVLGPDGKPFPRASVNVQGEGQRYTNTTTDAEGRFVFDAVCEGPARLFANSQGAGGNYLNAQLEAQAGDTNVVIRFGANGQGGRGNQGMATTSGTVFDPSGAPVPGLRVSVTPSTGMNQDVRSDADGKYSISWRFGNGRNPYIYARDAEHDLAVSRDLDQTTTNLDLRLQPALTLSAKVQDGSGQPIPTATADLRPFVGDMEFSFNRLPARADDQGHIEIRGLPPGRRYRVIITAKGFGTTDVRVQEADTKTTHFDFATVVLKAADRKLAGQVLGPDSKPVPGANVNMQGQGQPNQSTSTDARGHFAFNDVCEGAVQLYVNSQGQGGGFYMNANAQAQGGDTNVVIQFALNGNGGPANARLVTTIGTVLDPAGAPVAGARLSVMPGSGMNSDVRSDADGKYSLTWQEQIFGGRGGLFLYARDVERDLALGHDIDNTTTNLDLRLQPALTISVKVQDAQGKPIPAATATLVVHAGNMASSFNQVPAKADGQGVIEIKGLPQERHYSVNVTAKGYGSTNLQAQIGDTKTNRCEFPSVVLKAADQKLAGQVLGPDSKPVSGATVIMQGDGQPGGNARTDAKGRFVFDAVSEGAVRLFANGQDAGGAYMNGSVQAQGGDTNVVIRFGIDGVNNRNTRVVTTSGTVFDPAGAPVAGARLRIVSNYGSGTEVTSGADGKYSITWQQQNSGNTSLPFIYARDAEQHLAVSHDLDDTATNLDLRLQPALTLSVKVQDTNGKPIAAATDNLLAYSGNAGFVISQSSSWANAEGVIEFKGLPQERHYSALITALGYGTATVQAQIGDTKTNHFDFPTTVLKAADRKLAGQVLGPDSKPVPGASVNMQGDGQPNGNTRADAQGHFVFDAACEGPVRLFANNQGGRGNNMSGSVQAQGGDTNVVIRLGINAQGGVVNVQLVTTSGRVLDPDGAPVAGARLSVTPSAREIRSDANGEYSITWQFQNLSALAGTAAAAAAGRGGAAPPAIQPLLVGRVMERNLAAAVAIDEKSTNVDLHLQTALTISGAVQDPAGAPVKNAMISLLLVSGNSASSLGLQPAGTVDAQGTFSISNLPQSQRYTLNLTATGYGRASRQVAAAETATASLQLPPFILKVANQKLEGQVVDTNGAPVPRARVNLSGTNQPGSSTLTDANGHFVFNQVCEGPVSLFASGSTDGRVGSQVPSARLQALGGDTNVLVKLVLTNSAPAAGAGVSGQIPPARPSPAPQ